MEITINPDQLILTQSTYLKKVLKQFGTENGKLVSAPMEPGVANSLVSVHEEADDATVKLYQQLIGSLMWSTRPDLAYSVRVFSRYAHNPSQIHCTLIKRVLRYVVDTIDVGLTFSKQSDDDLMEYSDSDFADLKDKRH
jgi:hypothetical protein